MKLVIQIPCYNEEKVLAIAMRGLPRKLPGFSEVFWLVVDDGSHDSTAEIAKSCGADHVIRLPRHEGLATAFLTGLRFALDLGADCIVNTDADNQYCAEDIPKLLAPLIEGRADLVLGERALFSLPEISLGKKLLHALGRLVVSAVSRRYVPDPTSGFRAINRKCASKTVLYGKYTYTLETLIQAGNSGMRIESVKIRTNPPLRPSRLIARLSQYVWQSMQTISTGFFRYHPLGRAMRLPKFTNSTAESLSVIHATQN